MLRLTKKIKSDQLWLLLCWFIISASAIYFLDRLNTVNLILALIISGAGFKLTNYYQYRNPQNNDAIKDNQDRPANNYPRLVNNIFLLISLSALVVSFIILGRSATQESIISPWEAISVDFFYYFIISAWSFLIWLSQKEISTKVAAIAISLFYFLCLAVALIIYQIGYGFDPFIHQAASQHIADWGLIAPKNPYYIGQYSLVLLINKLLYLPIAPLNKFLVPVLAALILPWLGRKWLMNNTETPATSKAIPLALVLSLIIGFSPFIVSTPQNLAYLFLLATIIFGLNQKTLGLGLLSALATLFIHPLAGLPAILFIILILGKKYLESKNISSAWWPYVIAILSVPITPLVLSWGSGAKWQFNFSDWQALGLNFINQESWLLNNLYFWQKNYWYFLIILIILAIKIIYKKNLWYKLQSSLLMAGAMIGSLLISRFLIFEDLIFYEQGDYSGRLLIIALIFTWPALSLLFLEVAKKIRQQEIFVKLIVLLAASLFLTASLYLSYPRLDNYHNSRGYSLGLADVMAVQKIADLSSDNYLVLANQQVSVAALKTFGFSNYFPSKQGDIYFYSIPTGGPLYQYYLQMVYEEANRQTMIEAMDLVGVNEAFLVVNQYWWASDKIINEAKLSSNQWYLVNQGEVFIFQYLR